MREFILPERVEGRGGRGLEVETQGSMGKEDDEVCSWVWAALASALGVSFDSSSDDFDVGFEVFRPLLLDVCLDDKRDLEEEWELEEVVVDSSSLGFRLRSPLREPIVTVMRVDSVQQVRKVGGTGRCD